MKAKLLYLIYALALGLSFGAKGQSIAPTNTENYIISNSILKEGVTDIENVAGLPSGEKVTSVSYLDGLRRKKQGIIVGGSAQGTDVVSHHVYDHMGRAHRSYLPFTKSSNQGALVTDPISELDAFYSGESKYYSKNIYEAQRIKIYPVGNDWHAADKFGSVEAQYYIRSSDRIVRWSIGTDGLPVKGSEYGNGDLAKRISKDEDEKQAITYTDQFGNQVCKRVGDTDTYYIYDDYSNLLYVLPPKLVNAYSKTKVRDLAFKYVYDEKNRVIEEWVPGIEPTYYVYDKWDRLVLYQKGNNRRSFNGISVVENISGTLDVPSYQNKSYKISSSGTVTLLDGFTFKPTPSESFAVGISVAAGSGEWMFVKYDKEDRPVMKGKVTLNGGRATLQAVAETKTNRFEVRGSSIHGYTNDTYPNASQGVGANNVLEAFYYDAYGYPGVHAFTQEPIIAYTETATNHDGTFDHVFSRLEGLATGSKVKVLGIDGHVWLTTTTYYDDDYRPIQIITDHYLNSSITNNKDIVSSKYDFAGNVLQTKEVHKKNGRSDLVSQYRYTLDHVKSVDYVELKIDAGDWVKVSDYEYNNKGELTTLKNHNDNFETSYSYNIRGWNTQINNAHFTQNMQYQNATPALFNGNIASLNYINRAQNDNSISFNYTYDSKNRLTGAQNASFGSSYAYDVNGNITALTREHSGLEMDVLSYDYDVGNKLKKVTDTNGATPTATASFEFIDLSDNGQEYDYDLNGNVTRDDNRKITQVSYNERNLPKEVSIDGQSISYVYDAAGNKLRMIVINGDNTTTTEYAGNVVYTNVDNIDELIFMHFSQGRILTPATSPAFEYNITDHLGNVRVVLDNDGSPIQGNNYYPFGMVMWEGLNPGNNFLYQGKELNKLTEQYDFHARMYDPALGLFLGADPQKQFNSPYNAMGNNPVMMVDPDGEIAWFVPLIAGAVINTAMNYKKIDSFADGVKYATIGAASGALGAGLAAGMSVGLATSSLGGSFASGFGTGFAGAFSSGGISTLNTLGMTATSSFLSGAAIGGASGAGGGFVTGFGNSLVSGNNINSALNSGGNGALSGGISGGLYGGITGGIDAVREGRRFFDGATVQRTIIDRQLPYTPQQGDYNCGAACAENLSGGTMQQGNVRNSVLPGSNPNLDPLNDISVMQEFQRSTGRSVNVLGNRNPQNLFNEFSNGNDINISLRQAGTGIGHSVNLNRATHKVINKVSGKVVNKYIFEVMNPLSSGGGQYKTIGNASIRNAFRIFSIR